MNNGYQSANEPADGAGTIGLAAGASPLSLPTPKLMEWLVDDARTAEDLDSVVGHSPVTDRVIAAHAVASPRTLSKLSKSSDGETRARVTSNPNTATDDYVQLANDYPSEFLRNPLFDLLLFERPFFWREIRIGRFLVNARCSACPDDFWIWVTTEASWEWILEDLRGENLGDEYLAEICEDLRGPFYWQDVKKLLDMTTNEILISVFESSSLQEVIPHLVGHREPRVRQKVAENDYTSIQALELLADDPDATVRGAVASNHRTPESVIRRLAADSDSEVRYATAFNLKTPESLAAGIIEKAASSPELSVRIKVAECARTSEKILQTLARDPAWQVRWAVARNPHAPKDVLPALDSEVREAIRGLLETPDREEIFHLYGFDVLAAVAKNERTTGEVLHFLAFNLEHGVEVEIAEVIAANAAAPAETLRVLMDHDHKAVSIAVARNPATPVALLKTLSGSLDADVARVAKSKLVQRDRIGSRADL